MIIKRIAPILLLLHLLCLPLLAQQEVKDSLQEIVLQSDVPAEKMKGLYILLDQYLVDESDLDAYMQILNNIDAEYDEERLPILKIIQDKYCALGIDEKCEATIQQIWTIADKEKSSEYLIKSHIAKANYQYDKGFTDEAEKVMQTVNELIIKEKSPFIRSTYFLEKARQKRLSGQLDSTLYYLNYTLSELDQSQENTYLSDLFNEKGLAFRRLGKMDSAEHNYLKSLKIAESLSLYRALPKLYNNLGNIGHIKGDYNEAISFYVKSIELKEKQGNLRGLAVGYHNIGAIKNDMLDYHGAIKEFEKSNVLAKQVDYKLLIAYNALKTGSSYENLKEHEKAIENFKVGQSIAEEISFKKGTNAAHLGLGLNYTSLNKPVEAIFNLSKALQLAEEIGDKSEECSALIGIADWYNAFEGNLGGEEMIYYQNEIEDILLRAKDLSEEMNYGEKRLSVYNSLERYYEKRNDYKKHASILSEMQIYKDTLFSKTRAEAIAGWETKYATAEKEKEIIQLQADKEISELKATSWKIALGLTTLFLAILGYFLYKYQQRKNAQKQLEEAEKFRSKLSSDLHDDVGTMLSSLAMQSEVMGLTAKDEQVEKFEKLSNLSREAMSRMRDTVWAIDARKDKVDDLLDRMKDYVSDRLEGHPLQVSFDHKEVLKESKLRPDVRQNIYLIFKEAVHNAAKYSNGDKLNIIFKQNEKDLYLEVRDNGTIDEDKIKTSGLGTSNMKMRAERIGKTLEIHTKKGFAVIVK